MGIGPFGDLGSTLPLGPPLALSEGTLTPQRPLQEPIKKTHWSDDLIFFIFFSILR